MSNPPDPWKGHWLFFLLQLHTKRPITVLLSILSFDTSPASKLA